MKTVICSKSRLTSKFFFFSGCLLLAPVVANATRAGDDTRCTLPATTFKYAYLNQLAMHTVSDEQFLANANNHMDVVKAQVFLWYVYKNPKLDRSFFAKVDPRALVERRSDQINAILWLMAKTEHYFSALSPHDLSILRSSLDTWKKGYAQNAVNRNRALDLFAGDKPQSLNSLITEYPNQTTDVDYLVQVAANAIAAGELPKALLNLTRVAEYGYADGFIGLWKVIPQIDESNSCVSRVMYYMMLSGTLSPIDWLGDKDLPQLP